MFNFIKKYQTNKSREKKTHKKANKIYALNDLKTLSSRSYSQKVLFFLNIISIFLIMH